MKTQLLESIEKEIKELSIKKFNWKTSGNFDKLGSWWIYTWPPININITK